MQTKSDNKGAMLLMVLIAVMWSTGGIFIKLISWNALTIACIRGLIASFVIFAYAKKKGFTPKFNKYTWIISVPMAGCMTFFIIANKLTTAANAIVIQYLLPVWVLIIGVVVFKQKVKKADVAAVVICIAGIALFFFDQLSPGNMIGNFLAIISGICMAIMFTGNSHCNDSDVQFTGLIMGHALTFLAGLPGFLIEPFDPTMAEIGFIFALGIIQIGIPYILFAYVSTKISPLACSLIGMLEPLLNPVWVAIFYGEVPGFYALIGACIIIVTTSVWCVIQNREK